MHLVFNNNFNEEVLYVYIKYCCYNFCNRCYWWLGFGKKPIFGKTTPMATFLNTCSLGRNRIDIVTVIQGNSASRLTAALGILIIAALGGFFLASFHARKVIAPKAIIIVHAGVAVVGFLTLLSLVLGM